MKLSDVELTHLVFLSRVAMEGHNRALMEETMQCLLYIVKSLHEVDLPEGVVEEIRGLTRRIEETLKGENEKMSEIQRNLAHPGHRRPFGR